MQEIKEEWCKIIEQSKAHICLKNQERRSSGCGLKA